MQPIIEKKCGEKARKLIYSSAENAPTRSVPTSRAERAGFVLNDREILALSRWACAIERHYGMPMDMEWAHDGRSGALFVVQARPETVQSRVALTALRSYKVENKGRVMAHSTDGQLLYDMNKPQFSATFQRAATTIGQDTITQMLVSILSMMRGIRLRPNGSLY